MSEYKIIDISGWNDNLQYSKINEVGIVAAILRITEKNNKLLQKKIRSKMNK